MSTDSGSPSIVVLVGNFSPRRCTTSLLVFLSTKAELLTRLYSIRVVSSYPHHYVLLIVSHETRLYLYVIRPNINPLKGPFFIVLVPEDMCKASAIAWGLIPLASAYSLRVV